MKHRGSTSTETITANPAGSTSSIIVTGPKQTTTYTKGRGVYILESSGVYRWVRDESLDAAATEPPNGTFTAANT